MQAGDVVLWTTFEPGDVLLAVLSLSGFAHAGVIIHVDGRLAVVHVERSGRIAQTPLCRLEPEVLHLAVMRPENGDALAREIQRLSQYPPKTFVAAPYASAELVALAYANASGGAQIEPDQILDCAVGHLHRTTDLPSSVSQLLAELHVNGRGNCDGSQRLVSPAAIVRARGFKRTGYQRPAGAPDEYAELLALYDEMVRRTDTIRTLDGLVVTDSRIDEIDERLRGDPTRGLVARALRESRQAGPVDAARILAALSEDLVRLDATWLRIRRAAAPVLDPPGSKAYQQGER